MASVWKRVRPRPGKPDLVTWECRWREANGRQRRKSFGRKADADRYRNEVETRLGDGSYVDPRSRVTLGEYAEQWLAGRVSIKPKTMTGYRSLLDCWLLPRWGDARLSRITYEDVRVWVAEMAEQLSASRTRQAYFLLTSILDEAVKARRLTVNPARGAELPRLKLVRRRYLTHEQVDDLAAACGYQHGLVILVLAYTGIRWGEMAAIRADRLSLGARRIHIAEAMSEVNGEVQFGSPKSHADRWVSVPAFLREPLLELARGKRPSDLLFTTSRGYALRVRSFRRSTFDRAAREVGLEGLVPHELRHTAASLAIAAGANVKAVQTMLGHASAQLTLDRYSHLFDDALDTVADKLNEARSVSRRRPGDTFSEQ